jgi:hypothetical protein
MNSSISLRCTGSFSAILRMVLRSTPQGLSGVLQQICRRAVGMQLWPDYDGLSIGGRLLFKANASKWGKGQGAHGADNHGPSRT